MLSPHDAALVRRDPRVPGLACLLDSERAAILIQALFSSQVDACTLEYLRYKPGVNCLAGYRVAASGGETWVYAIAYGPDAAHKVAKARLRFQEAGLAMAGWVDECSGIVLYRFPGDRRIEGLAALAAGDEARRKFLARLLPDRPGLWQAGLTPLHYKPERRFVARLEGNSDRALVKMYGLKGHAQAISASAAFHAAPGLRIPRRWGTSSRHRAIVWEWVAGQPLPDVLAEGTNGSSALFRTGKALAELHSQRPVCITARSDGRAALQAAADAVAALAPSLAQRVQRLTNFLLPCLSSTSGHRTTIHGDFSADQILVLEDGAGDVAVLDLDHAAWGDPAEDFGSFVAELIQRRINGIAGATDEDAALQALLAGYEQRYRPPSAHRIHCHVAAHLLRRAPEAFRLRFTQDWPGQMESMLTLAEEEVARAQSQPV